jgi:hypothetical protein
MKVKQLIERLASINPEADVATIEVVENGQVNFLETRDIELINDAVGAPVLALIPEGFRLYDNQQEYEESILMNDEDTPIELH